MVDGFIFRGSQRDMVAAVCLQSVQREVRSACSCVLYNGLIAALKGLTLKKINLMFFRPCIIV